MTDALNDALFLAARYLHLVAMTLIVGGTLFYLWVVPVAIEELKEGSKLAVFARARWVFRNIVFSSVLILLLSGAIITARSMWVYRGQQIPIFRQVARLSHPENPHTQTLDHPTVFERPAFWFAFHACLGVASMLIAVALVRRATPPRSPLPWMRLNFVLLMIVILLACMTRSARQRLFDSVRPTAGALTTENHY